MLCRDHLFFFFFFKYLLKINIKSLKCEHESKNCDIVKSKICPLLAFGVFSLSSHNLNVGDFHGGK